MSPNLEGIMLNRNANLSTRRLLAEPFGGGPQRTPTITSKLNGTPNPYREYYDQPQYTQGAGFTDNYLQYRQIRDDRVFYGETPFREPNAAPEFPYGSTVLPTKSVGLDAREIELVFRFDPQPPPRDESKNAGVLYNQGTPQPPRPQNGRPLPEVPQKDGPFVFGVHGPNNFRSGRPSDDYDYAHVPEDTEKTVINGNTRVNAEDFCDKRSESDARGDAKRNKTGLNRMFQIKDNRCRRRSSLARRGRSKERIKCVLVGDGAVGKTSLITAYAQNEFRSEYAPTAYDNFNVVVEVDDRPICVEICDTAGQDSMEQLRSLCYPGTDVLMLCFSVVKPETFRSIANRWVPAIANVKAPLVLVGTQCDLATDRNILHDLRLRGEHVVTEAEARMLASKINAEYMETSSKMRTKLKDAFDCAILAALPIVSIKKPLWKKLLCLRNC